MKLILNEEQKDVYLLLNKFDENDIYTFCKESIRVLRSGSSKEIIENLAGKCGLNKVQVESILEHLVLIFSFLTRFKDDEIRPIVDEVVQVCKHLKISSDPMQWSVDDTIKWLVYYIQLLKLNNQILDTFKLSGQSLCYKKIDDFQQVQAVDLYWKLQVWKKCLNFGTNHLLFESSGESDTKSWNSAESFDLSETINMSWLDEDYNYTLTCLDDDLLDSNYQNQCLPSLDDISLPSFYTSSLNSNFKLDSKDKDEIQFPRLSNDNEYLQSIYEFNYQLNSSSSNLVAKCQTQDSQLQITSSSDDSLGKHYYNNDTPTSPNEPSSSTYLTLLQANAQNGHHPNGHEMNLNQQVHTSDRMNQNLNNNQMTNQMNMNQQVNHSIEQANTHPQISSTTSSSSSSPKFHQQYQQHVQYLQNNNTTMQTVQPKSLPSVASLKNQSADNNLNHSNLINSNGLTSSSSNNLRSNSTTVSNLNNVNSLLNNGTVDLASSTQQQLELNNSTANGTIKLNANCLNAYYQTTNNADQLHHNNSSNQLTYHHLHHHVQQSNHHHQFINSKNAFATIDSNHQLTSSSSPSSISSSSNSSPLPSLSSPTALSPDNLTTTTIPNITTTTTAAVATN